MPDITATERDSKLIVYFMAWQATEQTSGRKYRDPVYAFTHSTDYNLFQILNGYGEDARNFRPHG